MNAPATQAQVERPAGAARAEDLVSLELIRTLVGFDTTSRDSNLALIEWVRRYLTAVRHRVDADVRRRRTQGQPVRDAAGARRQFDARRHRAVRPHRRGAGRRPAVGHGSVHGRGQGRAPVRPRRHRHEEFLRGRLAFIPEFLRRGLAKPLHFALSYDEEVGCIGVRRLIADIVARGVQPAGCIVGEPTGMETVVAHKGKKGWRCRVRGFEAHSSLTPLGVNAVQIACEIVAHIARRTREFRDAGTQDGAYDVPYTTVHVGVIHAARHSTSCPATARSTSRSATCRSTTRTRSSPTCARSRRRSCRAMHA